MRCYCSHLSSWQRRKIQWKIGKTCWKSSLLLFACPWVCRVSSRVFPLNFRVTLWKAQFANRIFQVSPQSFSTHSLSVVPSVEYPSWIWAIFFTLNLQKTEIIHILLKIDFLVFLLFNFVSAFRTIDFSLLLENSILKKENFLKEFSNVCIYVKIINVEMFAQFENLASKFLWWRKEIFRSFNWKAESSKSCRGNPLRIYLPLKEKSFF